MALTSAKLIQNFNFNNVEVQKQGKSEPAQRPTAAVAQDNRA